MGGGRIYRQGDPRRSPDGDRALQGDRDRSFLRKRAVITGSHNFSFPRRRKTTRISSSSAETETGPGLRTAHQRRLRPLFLARYLGSGGDPDQIYKPLDGWSPAYPGHRNSNSGWRNRFRLSPGTEDRPPPRKKLRKARPNRNPARRPGKPSRRKRHRPQPSRKRRAPARKKGYQENQESQQEKSRQ